MLRSSIPLRPVSVRGYSAVAVTPHGLSTQAAMTILAMGGNAVDAAIAANAAQGVVAPETCGIGGDLFVLLAGEGDDRPAALNASGRAGSGALGLAEELRAHGHDSIPQRHPGAVSVPGCVDGWIELHRSKGRLELGRILEPAIRLAKNGFPASRELARAFGGRREELVNEPSAVAMYPGAKPPLEGERIVRPELARTLEGIAEHGRKAFYDGTVGQAISEATGGAITADDLASPHQEWVEALSVDVFGSTAWTVPPNSQGYIALLGMAILHRFGIEDLDDPLAWHLSIEAYRQAAADRDDLLADPDSMAMHPADLVAAARVEEMVERISLDRVADASPANPGSGGTAYMCVVDGEGLGVSLIQSNFHGIGSGRSARGTGFLLQDRGRGFTLQPGHPNELRPGRRPLHTLSPTLWTTAGKLRAVVGTRGGHIQPALIMQLAHSLIGHQQDAAGAMAFPRWASDLAGPSSHPSVVQVEPGAPEAVTEGLTQRGHRVESLDFPQPGWGPMSAITVTDDLRTGVADPRVDTATAAAS